MSKGLKIGDFARSGPVGSGAHTFTRMIDDGRTICLESCLDGYCIALYDRRFDLIGEKKCTNMGELMAPQVAPGFSLGSGEALIKAIDIANTMI